VRGDWAFGEQLLDIADNAANDWSYNEKTGKLSVNKELVLRSKLRIEARQFHMRRLHPQQWGERQQIDLKSDWSLLTLEERQRKAQELIAMVEEMKQPPPAPPPIVYRAEEPPEDDDQQQRGIGWQPRSASGREG
jgi:Bacteriophage Sf6, terminase small subunit-like